MGSYSTLSRSEKKPMGYFARNSFGGNQNGTWALPRMGTSQSTYSFRTVPGEDGLEDDVRTARNAFRTFDPRHDTGHDFWTIKRELPRLSHANFTMNGQFGVRYQGPLLLKGSQYADEWQLEAPSLMSQNDINLYGTRAITQTRPLNSIANLAQTLAEVTREGSPSVPASIILSNKGMNLRGIGDEVLNWEFGWRPIVNDTVKTAQAIADASVLLKQVQRDSGRQVRRRYYFPVEKKVEETFFSGDPFMYPSGLDSSFQQYIRDNPGWPSGSTVRTETTTQYWFSAAYSYHLDLGPSLNSKLEGLEQKVNLLLGTRVTPEVLWNLTPWSWFVDWFATIGPVLGNMSAMADDGLVMRYGYLMRKTHVRRTVSVPFLTDGQKNRVENVSCTFVSTTKERRRATPYGFGLNTSSFTARQWAILAALGLTKAPNALMSAIGA